MTKICKTHHCSVSLNYKEVHLNFRAPWQLRSSAWAQWNCAECFALWVSDWAVCLLRKGSGVCLLLAHLDSAPCRSESPVPGSQMRNLRLREAWIKESKMPTTETSVDSSLSFPPGFTCENGTGGPGVLGWVASPLLPVSAALLSFPSLFFPLCPSSSLSSPFFLIISAYSLLKLYFF